MGKVKYMAMSLVAWLLLILCAVMCEGCKSKEFVPVTEIRTDTVIKAHYDTVYIERKSAKDNKVLIKDSIVHKDSVSTTVDEQGNVKKVESWHNIERYRDTQKIAELRDSVKMLKAAADSLMSQGYHYKPSAPIYVDKELSWWNKFEMWCGDVLLALLFLKVLGALLTYKIGKNKLK